MSKRNKKDQIVALLRQGVSYRQIAKQVPCSKGTVCFHAKRLQMTAAEQQGSAKRYDWAEIQRYYDEGHSCTECAQKFGFSLGSWSYAASTGKLKVKNPQYELETILVPNRATKTHDLKKRLVEVGLLEYKCLLCGISEWKGKPLSLHLDHINGENKDNRLVNLRLLCPNCHSQTDTYSAKNKKSMKQAIPDELECRVCHTVKSMDEFPVRRDLRLGRLRSCKICSLALTIERRNKAKPQEVEEEIH